MHSCTVIVAQYNPDKIKLLRTLRSIIRQINVNIQIVIADDGSGIDWFQDAEKLLLDCQIKDYVFCKNKTNQGTVINVWNGLMKAKYNSVTLISPGDYFYDNTAIHDAIEMKTNGEYVFLFGKPAPFHWNGNEVVLRNRLFPCYLAPYREFMQTNRYEKIQKYRTLFYDGMAGPGTFWDKELLLSYLKRVLNKVIYIEDIVTIFAVLDKKKIGFLDRFLVWYEIGSGVSSSKSQKWIDAINHDKTVFYDIAAEYHPESRNVRRARLLQAIENIGGIRAKLLKPVLFPDRFFYLLFHDVLFREKVGERDTGFIKMLDEVQDNASH